MGARLVLRRGHRGRVGQKPFSHGDEVNVRKTLGPAHKAQDMRGQANVLSDPTGGGQFRARGCGRANGPVSCAKKRRKQARTSQTCPPEHGTYRKE